MQRQLGTTASWRITALALASLASACGGGGDAPERARAGEGAAGGAEGAEARPYTSPPGFALPFRTVLPPGFRADPALEGRGDAVGFAWEGGGGRGDSALVHLFVYPPGRSEDAAREVVRTAAERVRIPGDRSELTPVRLHPWAVVEYPIRSTGTAGVPVVGWVALGNEGGRWFHLIVQAPEPAWPRFEPHVERILAEWRWTGAGRSLAAPGGGVAAPATEGSEP